MNEIIREIINQIVDAGFEAYIVGGYVRDYLLGFKSYDIDIATIAHVEDLVRIFGNTGKVNKTYYDHYHRRNWIHRQQLYLPHAADVSQ